MWILELQDKLYWLIKGQSYTIGRNSKSQKNDDGFIGVKDDARVSRQHITIEVRSTSSDSALHPSVRSELVITDLNSRFGTKVEETALEPGSSHTLPYSSTGMGRIKLGTRTKIRVLWQSFVITYSTGQSGQSHDTLWQHALDILEPLDVKLMPYIVKSTDLFVKTGKSTTSLYYALTKQIPIVNNQYFTALQTSAEETSRNGTLDSSVLPKFEPFLPEPRWAPNKGRTNCFANFHFHVPSLDFAQAIEPILESAGGICVPSESANRLNAIYIYSSTAATAKPLGIRYVRETAVFNALEECRPLRENEIQSNMGEAAMSEPVPSARRTKLNILDIMTTQSSQRANELTPSGNNFQKPDSPNTSDVDITMAQGLSAAAGSKRVISASQQHAEEGNPAATGKKIPLEVAANQSRTRSKLRGQKRAPETQLQHVPSKRRAKGTDMGHTDPGFITDVESDDLGEDLAVQNYDNVGELAIVEFSVETVRTPATTRTGKTDSIHASFRARSNFKAFKRFGNAVGNSKLTKVEYAYEAVNEKHDFDDDEMLIDGDDETVSSGKDISNIDSSGLVSMSKSNMSTVSEEQLFVASEEDEGGMDTTGDLNFNNSGDASLEQQELTRMQSLPRPVDEFDFSFS